MPDDDVTAAVASSDAVATNATNATNVIGPRGARDLRAAAETWYVVVRLEQIILWYYCTHLPS